ncbi:UPF3B family protein [Megaselia abdita]
MGEKRAPREKKKPQTKVIIRQLPPTMTEEEFLKQIDLPQHDDFYFVAPDWSLGLEATCRAYINFTNTDDVFLFQERFDGYVFVDSKGTEYPAQVEYAPFQGFSKSRSKKKDIKASSIETDVHYLEFVERFNNQENDMVKGDLKVDFNLNAKKDLSGQSTPLLEYLQDKKDARREERKRRNDERKEKRDKDRQQKKILVAKNIPPAIKEEATGTQEQKTEGRVDSKEGTSKNSQEDKGSQRDRYSNRIQRKREKDAKRRERRDQKRAEERRGSKESVESVSKKIEDLKISEGASSTGEKEKSEGPKDIKEENKKPVEQNEKKEKSEKKDYREERERRNERRERDRVRNKDRPDMQIYQPGKLRVNPSNAEEGTPCTSTGAKKRVSRYSEKRRAKESSSSTTGPPKEEPETPSDNL